MFLVYLSYHFKALFRQIKVWPNFTNATAHFNSQNLGLHSLNFNIFSYGTCQIHSFEFVESLYQISWTLKQTHKEHGLCHHWQSKYCWYGKQAYWGMDAVNLFIIFNYSVWALVILNKTQQLIINWWAILRSKFIF